MNRNFRLTNTLLAAISTLTCLTLVLAIVATGTPSLAGAMLLHISRVSPRVGQCGTVVDVTIQGMCIQDAQEIIFYKPGIKAISIEPLPDLEHPIGLAHGGRIQEQIRCRIAIDADCKPGEYPFRIRTTDEISSLGTFHVTPFPVIDENEKGYNTNDSLANALDVSPNTTVRGELGHSGKGDVDLYRVPVKAGSRLSVEVDSVKIADIHYGGSEYDVALRILDQDGKEMASNDDNSIHLQDPLVSTKIAHDGFAYVEVKRSLFVQDSRVYAVHIGTFQRPLIAFPLGIHLVANKRCCSWAIHWENLARQWSFPNKKDRLIIFWMDHPSEVAIFIARQYVRETQCNDKPSRLTPNRDQRRIVREWRTGPIPISCIQGRAIPYPRLRRFARLSIDPKITLQALSNTPDATGKIELESDDVPLSDRDIYGTSFRGQGGLKDTSDPSVIWEVGSDGDYVLELEDRSGNTGRNSCLSN